MTDNKNPRIHNAGANDCNGDSNSNSTSKHIVRPNKAVHGEQKKNNSTLTARDKDENSSVHRRSRRCSSISEFTRHV